MHCGFAMISVGCVRAKFAKHIAMLILVDACTSGIAWYFFGYAAHLLLRHAREMPQPINMEAAAYLLH